MYLKYILRENPWINIEEYNRNILIFLDVNGILSTTKFTIVVNKSKEKSMVGLIIYLVLGYWAVGETIYKNKILFSTQTGGIFIEKLVSALMLGWICIPVAIIKLIFFRR